MIPMPLGKEMSAAISEEPSILWASKIACACSASSVDTSARLRVLIDSFNSRFASRFPDVVGARRRVLSASVTVGVTRCFHVVLISVRFFI